MSTLRLQPLSGEQLLERGLSDLAEIQARPRPMPRQVFGVWLENFGAGIGAAALSAVGLYAVGAPDMWLVGGSVGAGVFVFGSVMVWRATQDELSAWSNRRQIKQAVKMIAQEYATRDKRRAVQLEAALDTIDEMDAELAQARRSLDQMTRERDMAIYDLTREKEAAGQRANGRSTFVPARTLAPQDIADATEMIRYYYEWRVHPSKDRCKEKWQWGDDRWKAAQVPLVDSGILKVNTTQNKWIPQTLDEALGLFAEYMLHARQLSVPTINHTLGRVVYAEGDE